MLLLLLATASACGRRDAERVVLVTIDTLRADHVGCYGAPIASTPTLDALAARGVRFETALAPTPLTLPSHTSLMTALDPPRHGVRNNSTFRLDENIPVLAERMRAAGFATAAFLGAVVLDRQYGLARGFEVYDDQMSLRNAAGEFGFAERTADRVVDEALEWLETAPDRFLLWVHLYDPHAGYRPPPRFADAFPHYPYAGEIAFADAELGRLLAAVDARWTDGSTLVAVTSDHGESLGEHGEITHSLAIYEATQRIPLLLAGAQLPVGHTASGLARLIDVAPTVLALAGAEPLPGADGRDLRLLLGTTQTEQRIAYLETLATQLDFGWSPLLGLRDARWKYIRAPRPELYDLARDPHETRDLAVEDAPRAAAFDALLDERLAGARIAAPELTPDAAMRERLQQLGYLVEGPGTDPDEIGRVGGIDPKDGVAVASALQVGISLMAAGRPAEALQLLEPLADGGYQLDVYRAEAARRAGDPVLAERYARAAVARAPRARSPHEVLGEALEARGRWEEAARAFEDASQLDPAAAEPSVGLGRVAEARGEPEAAARYFAQAAESRSGSAEALWRLAALRIERGEPALELIAKVPAAELERPEAAVRLARAEARAGRTDSALARLRRALASAPASKLLREALHELRTGGR